MKYARIHPQRLRAYPPAYHRKWFRVHEEHPDPLTQQFNTHPGYVWVETPWKIRGMLAEDLEIVERPELELDPRELAVQVTANAAGGVIVRITHLPTRRFASGAGADESSARAVAEQRLLVILRRRRAEESKG